MTGYTRAQVVSRLAMTYFGNVPPDAPIGMLKFTQKLTTKGLDSTLRDDSTSDMNHLFFYRVQLKE